jgi:hypothetical protein
MFLLNKYTVTVRQSTTEDSFAVSVMWLVHTYFFSFQYKAVIQYASSVFPIY